MVGAKNIQTKRKEGTSSRRRPLSSRRATEVYGLCSCETALLLFGPGGRFYNPRIEEVLSGLEQSERADPVGKKHHSEYEATVQELYRKCAEAKAELEAVKRRREELEEIRLLETPIEELNSEESIKLLSIIDKAQLNVQKMIEKRSAELSNPTESGSSNAVESFECSASIASGGSESVDMDVNNDIQERN